MQNRRTRHHLRRITALARPLVAFYRSIPPRLDPLLFRLTRRGGSALARLNRYLLLRARAAGCGEVVDIREDVYIFAARKLRIGSYVSIHPMTYIDATGGVQIGDNVSIAHSVTIMSTSHEFSDATKPIREQPVSLRPTTIGNDVWIGAGARILGGCRIADGTIVAAGAVVTGHTRRGDIVGGVPARVIKSRTVQPVDPS